MGFGARKLPVADHASREERRRVERYQGPDARVGAGERHADSREPRGEQRQKEPAPVPARSLEAEHEGEEVERERQHPEEGNGRDVERHVAGEGEEQQGGAAGERRPERLQSGSGLARLASRERLRLGAFAAPGERRARKREQREPRGPDGRLRAQGEKRLDGEGIRDEREHRAQIGQRKQPIGRSTFARARVPGLHQRARGGQREIGQPDARREEAEYAPRRVFAACGLPGGARGERQRRRGEGEERNVDVAPGRDAQAHVGVRIDVAGEQQHLEKEHADRPHRRAAAEPGQDDLGDERLHLEEQEGAQENRDGVEDHEILSS